MKNRKLCNAVSDNEVHEPYQNLKNQKVSPPAFCQHFRLAANSNKNTFKTLRNKYI